MDYTLSDMRRRFAIDMAGVEEAGELEDRALTAHIRAKRFRAMADQLVAELRVSVSEPHVPKRNIDETHVSLKLRLRPSKELREGDEEFAEQEKDEHSKNGENVADSVIDITDLVKGSGELSSGDPPRPESAKNGNPDLATAMVRGKEVIDLDAMKAKPTTHEDDDGDLPEIQMDWGAIRTFQDDSMLAPVPEEERAMCLSGEACEVFWKVGHPKIKIGRIDFWKVLNLDWFHADIMDAFGVRVSQRSESLGLPHLVTMTQFSDYLRYETTTTKKGVVRHHYSYKKVENFFQGKGIDISELDAVFAPAIIGRHGGKRGNHWIMIVLEMKTKTMIHDNPLSSFVNSEAKRFIEDLKHWVYDEVMSIKGDKFAKLHFKRTTWNNVYNPPYPTQVDGDSCGPYVLGAMEVLSRGRLGDERKAKDCKMEFSEDFIPILRCRIALALRNGLSINTDSR